jgi:hypothetical protein
MMDIWIWAGAACAVLLLGGLAFVFAPARTTILVDTATSTARVEQKLLWGAGPLTYKRILPQSEQGVPMAVFYDPSHIGAALMTPGLADATYRAVQGLFAFKPGLARFELLMNLPDPAQTRVIDTAAHAAMAVAPVALRDSVVIGKCETPGAELHAKFELMATPGQINTIYNTLKESRSGREFAKRLKRKPKPQKRPVREVRAP